MGRKINKGIKSMENVGERLIAARESTGLERKEAAEKLGVSYHSLHAIETGLKTPSLDRLHEIAIAWGVDPAALDDRLASNSKPSPSPSSSPTVDVPQETGGRRQVENLVKLLSVTASAISGLQETLEEWLKQTPPTPTPSQPREPQS